MVQPDDLFRRLAQAVSAVKKPSQEHVLVSVVDCLSLHPEAHLEPKCGESVLIDEVDGLLCPGPAKTLPQVMNSFEAVMEKR